MESLTVDIALQGIQSKDLETVKKLNLWASDLNDVSLVKEMPNLEILVLSANNISSLKDIQFCENLRELYLRNNKIKSLNEIYYLKGLKNLKILWLDENPCSYSKNYRLSVIKNLKNLEYLDNKPITEEEVKQAFEAGLEYNNPTDSIEEYEKLILPLNNYENENSNGFKSIEETEKTYFDSTNGLENDEFQESDIEKGKECISQDKIKNDNVLSAILILLENLSSNQLDEVIVHCEKLKNSC